MMLPGIALPPRGVITVAAFGAAVVCGLATAIQPAAGIAFLLGLAFVALALLNLPLALALAVPLTFLRYMPVVSVAPALAFALVLMAWFGTLSPKGSPVAARLWRWRVVWLVAIVLVWLALTVGMSSSRAAASEEMLSWCIAALLALIYFTTLLSERHVRLVVGGFVAGALLTVLIGLLSVGLRPPASTLESVTYTEGRLQAGGLDPNLLAAGLVPALALAGGLLATTRSALLRCSLLLAAAVITVGLAATQSRGGLVAAVAAAFVALFVMRGQRLRILAAMTIAVGMIGFWLVLAPGALERVTSGDDRGNGREDLWTVAWRMFEDHPVTGVGLAAFEQSSPPYVQRPGQLTWVELIVDRPHVAHNTYLQLLAETGIVGLALYLAMLAAFLAASWRAARRFDARGEPRLATLARSLFVAQVGIIVALVFLSAAPLVLFWPLYGVSGALLMLSRSPAQDRRGAAGSGRAITPVGVGG